jgi:predicted RNase H-like HicB family nuclease
MAAEVIPMRYPVVIHKDPNSDYGVTVPDLPGCFSAGATMDEALGSAIEAIESHVEGLMLDAEPIPTPKTVESHKDNTDFTGGIWALVDVDLTQLSGKARRVNVTIPERVLSLIDDYASRHGETRSGLITQAALEFIAEQAEAA